eukprot:148628_1
MASSIEISWSYCIVFFLFIDDVDADADDTGTISLWFILPMSFCLSTLMNLDQGKHSLHFRSTVKNAMANYYILLPLVTIFCMCKCALLPDNVNGMQLGYLNNQIHMIGGTPGSNRYWKFNTITTATTEVNINSSFIGQFYGNAQASCQSMSGMYLAGPETALKGGIYYFDFVKGTSPLEIANIIGTSLEPALGPGGSLAQQAICVNDDDPLNILLYVSGGRLSDSSGYSNITLQYDVTNSIWSSLPSFNGGRTYHSCQFISHNKNIYTIGGSGSGSFYTIEKYNILTDSAWNILNLTLPHYRYRTVYHKRNNQIVLLDIDGRIDTFDITAETVSLYRTGAYQSLSTFVYDYDSFDIYQFGGYIGGGASGYLNTWIKITIPTQITDDPTVSPSNNPTYRPTKNPTRPTIDPTTAVPTQATVAPTSVPTQKPIDSDSPEGVGSVGLYVYVCYMIAVCNLLMT